MSEPISPLPPIKDRSVGLILFGILTIALGGICALLIPLMLFSLALSEKSGQAVNGAPSLIPAMATYGVLAVALIWLGIGSILKRRWARALLLIGSWSWLIFGVLALISMAFMVRPMLESIRESTSQMDSSISGLFLLIPAAMMIFIFLILPASWVFFYRSPHVKATCEYYDPMLRWTDRCPMPVLAAVVWLAFSVVTTLILVVEGPAVVPVFGKFVIGMPARLIFAATAVIWIYGIWGFYRLDGKAWWVVGGASAIFMLSGGITYSTADVMEIYPKLGYSPEQVAQIAKYHFMNGSVMVGMTLFWCIPVFGFLIYLRRFFFPPKPAGGVSA